MTCHSGAVNFSRTQYCQTFEDVRSGSGIPRSRILIGRSLYCISFYWPVFVPSTARWSFGLQHFSAHFHLNDTIVSPQIEYSREHIKHTLFMTLSEYIFFPRPEWPSLVAYDMIYVSVTEVWLKNVGDDERCGKDCGWCVTAGCPRHKSWLEQRRSQTQLQ